MYEDEIKKLNATANFFRGLKNKIILIKLIEQAKTEYDKCDFKSGRKTLLEAYRIDKHNPIVLRGLGCINQFRKKYNLAERYFKHGLEYSSNKEIEYTLLGILYYIQNKLDSAIEAFENAINVNDSYDPAYEGKNQAMLERHLQIVDLQETLKNYKIT